MNSSTNESGRVEGNGPALEPRDPIAIVGVGGRFPAGAFRRLPVRQRGVVGLVYYHGWTQDAVAELFGVSVHTVQRY